MKDLDLASSFIVPFLKKNSPKKTPLTLPDAVQYHSLHTSSLRSSFTATQWTSNSEAMLSTPIPETVSGMGIRETSGKCQSTISVTKYPRFCLNILLHIVSLFVSHKTLFLYGLHFEFLDSSLLVSGNFDKFFCFRSAHHQLQGC